MRPRCEFAASTAAKGFCTTACSAQPTRIQPTARTIVRLRLLDIYNTAASDTIELVPGKQLFARRKISGASFHPNIGSRLRASLSARLPGKLGRAMRATGRFDWNGHRASRTIFDDRFGVFRLLQAIDRAHYQENGARHDEEIDRERNKVAVIQRNRTGFGRVRRRVEIHAPVLGRAENHKLVREIEPARKQTQWRHDDVFNQRIDDPGESRPNDHANGQIDRISFDREFFEFLPNFSHTTMFTNFFGTMTVFWTILPAMSC